MPAGTLCLGPEDGWSVDRRHRRLVENDGGDAGRQPGVTGMTDADACDIGEEILHQMYPAEGR